MLGYVDTADIINDKDGSERGNDLYFENESKINFMMTALH
jgi:hypothetical protein